MRVTKQSTEPFLSTKSVQDGDPMLITGAPTLEMNKWNKFQTVIKAKHKQTGKVYRWGLNIASKNNLVDAFGEDGDKWVNRTVRVQLGSAEVNGEVKDSLIAIPVTEE